MPKICVQNKIKRTVGQNGHFNKIIHLFATKQMDLYHLLTNLSVQPFRVGELTFTVAFPVFLVLRTMHCI